MTGLHAVAVARAGLVVGRPRHRLTDPGSRRTVVEDAPVAVAVARRGLLPRPRFRHVVLGLADDAPEALDVLRRFAQRLHHHDVAVTVAGLDAAVPSAVLADAVFELGGAVGRRARSAVIPAREAGQRWDGDELVVCVGRPRGAHGHQGPDAVERVLLAQDSPSLLVLPPPSVDVSPAAPAG